MNKPSVQEAEGKKNKNKPKENRKKGLIKITAETNLREHPPSPALWGWGKTH